MKHHHSLFHISSLMPVAILSLAFTATICAQPIPTLDLNFRPVITRIGGSVSAAAVQADGKLILAGGFNAINGVARNGIARVNPDGSIDPTFDPGAGACCASSIGQTQVASTISATVLQSDGKVVIGGAFSTVNGTPRKGLARLNADGTLDKTFDPGAGLDLGQGALPAGVVSVIVVQPDGKLLIGGSFSGVSGVNHGGIARLEANGSLDVGFNPGLGVMDDQGRPGQVAAIALLNNGQVLIGGNFSLLDNIPRNAMARLSAAGSLDPAFDPGIVQLDNTLPPPSIDGLVVQPDGKIVFSGSFRFVDSDTRLGLARINPDTTLDSTFNPSINPDNPETFRVLGLQGDGKIIAYHEFTDANGNSQRVIARLNKDGSVDSTYGLALQPGTSSSLQVQRAVVQADGKWVVVGNFVAGPDATARGVGRINVGGGLDASFNPRLELSEDLAQHVQAAAVQKDGKVVIGGTFTRINGIERNKLARINRDGSLDTAFNPVIQPADPQNFVAAVTIQDDGKIVIGGFFTSVNGTSRNSLARLKDDGSLDESFDTGTGTNDGAGTIGHVLALAVQDDGKVIVGGDFAVFNGQGTPWIVRLSSNGSVEQGLAGGLKCLNCDTSEIRTVALLSTGHIMIIGVFNRISGRSYNGIARLLPDGSVDPAFETPVGTDEQPDALAVQSDDKTIVAILSSASNNGANQSRLLRLNSDGTVDSSFSPGNVVGDGSSATPVSALKVDADDRILIGGAFTSIGGTPRHDFARLKKDGAPDTDFDAGSGLGSAVVSAPGNARVRIGGIDLQDDGGIIVGGNFAVANGQVRLGLARFQAEPPTQGGGSKPRILSPARGADGRFSMTVSGEVGRTYRVEASTDLRAWTSIGNVTGAATPQPFSDPGAKNLPYRFYRAVGQ